MRHNRIVVTWTLFVFAWGAAAFAAESETVRGPARVRSGPGALHAQVAVLAPGTSVRVVERRGSWARVKAGETKGWVSVHVLGAPAGGEAKRRPGLAGLRNASALSKVPPSVVVAAAKGAFSSAYASRHGASVAPVQRAASPSPDELAEFSAPLKRGRDRPRAVDRFLGELKPQVMPDPALEAMLGQALAARFAAMGLVADRTVLRYVNLVGARVAACSPRNDLRYVFFVLRGKEPAAFATPGGYVFVTWGTLAAVKDEAELAGLLGHETAHVVRLHGMGEFRRRALKARSGDAFSELAADTEATAEEIETVQDLDTFADQAFEALSRGRSVRQEQEADLLGVTYAAAAGYDPAGLERLFDRLRVRGAAAYGTRPKAGTHLPLK